ncbi:MAG: extracellular solute-binding protein [Rhodospirillaceae bacterium]|nr:extracellular solute-binding protein [Rhodospirillaceae bacterium]
MRRVVICFALLASLAAARSHAAATIPDVVTSHAIAMHGSAKYPADFRNFDYVNPDALKGGKLWLALQGTFDSLNPFIIKGAPASGATLIYDTLMKKAEDEPYTLYPLLAEQLRYPKDRSWVEFTLNPQARWHDGRQVTVEDVIFSMNVLRTKGRPFFRYYFRDVAKMEKTGPQTVKFSFRKSKNRELPLIIAGDLVILPKHYWARHDFTKFSLKPPLGSGPYRISKVSPGRRIEYVRVKNYWARDLPANVGYGNFDLIRYEYFFDSSVMREALKAGQFDYRAENTASAWARAYDIKAKREGQLIQKKFPNGQPSGMQAFVYNMRRPVFKDWRVRRALVYAFDFDWTNRNLFFGQYKRTRSFFDNSELAARKGKPASEVLMILQNLKKRFPNDVPDRLFSMPYTLPVYKDSNIRPGLHEAFRLLKQAGWVVRDFKLVHAKTGAPLRFELLLRSPAFERIVLPLKRNLRRLGVDMRVRLVDFSQFVNRVRKFDFDVVVLGWGQSLSPGNEQRGFWSSSAAERPGSQNWAGLRNRAVDSLVEQLIAAPDRKSLVLRTRALDRFLLSLHFVIPNWHIPYNRVVFWNKFGYTDKPTISGVNVMNWWVDPEKAAKLRGRISSLK